MACRRRARAYFDKDVADLTLHEAAYLAVLPKAPTNYDPLRATQKALDRRNYVLREMAGNGFITEAPARRGAATPLGTIRYGSNAKFRELGGYFMEEVRRDLIERFGENAEDGPNSVYAGGLWVRTSMVPLMQDAAADALREGLAKFDGGRGWRDTKLSIDLDGDWRGATARRGARHRLSRLAQGGGARQIGGSAEIGFGDGTTGTLSASAARSPSGAAAGPPSASSSRAW